MGTGTRRSWHAWPGSLFPWMFLEREGKLLVASFCMPGSPGSLRSELTSRQTALGKRRKAQLLFTLSGFPALGGIQALGSGPKRALRMGA